MPTTIARLSSNGVYFTSGNFDEITHSYTTGSLSFASSNYLQTPSMPSMTGDFAIELYFYSLGSATGISALIESRIANTETPYWIGLNNGGVVAYTDNASGTTGLGSYIQAGWNHLVVCRKSGILSTYLNGNLTQARAYAGAFGGNRLLIGNDTLSRVFTGYISNLRIINGSCVYSNNYTNVVPAAPYNKEISTTMLLKSPYSLIQYPQTVGPTSNIVNTPNGLYGGAPGLSFDGSSSFLEINSNSWVTLNSDFTIEFWVFFNSFATTQVLINGTWTNANQLAVWHHTSYPGKISVWSWAGYSSITPFLISTTTMVINRWYHVAVTRSGNNFRLFINGNLESTYGSAITINQPLKWIGKYFDGTTSIQYFGGLLSNVHVARSALYTASFTVPSAPLSPASSTVFLMNDVNDLPWRSIAKPGPLVLSGSPLSADNSSILFNGSTDYLNLGNFSAFPLTGDFTAEFWIKISSYPAAASYYTILDTWQSGQAAGSGNTQIDIDSSGRIDTYYDGASHLVSSLTLSLNAWNHVAVVRSSGVLYTYVNGIQDTATAAFTNPAFKNNYNFNVGRQSSTNTLYLNGYLSNVRITKDVALYTTKVVDSLSGVLSATPETVLLLNSPYSTLTNGISSNGVVAAGTSSLTLSSGSPFGTGIDGSLVFNGSSTYLYSPQRTANWDFSSGTFTIECWVKFNTGSLGAYRTLMSNYLNPSNGWSLQVDTNSKLTFNASGDAADITGTTTLQVNIWYHVAVSGSPGSYKMFINGVQEGITFTGATVLNGGPLYIGKVVASGTSYYFLNGYISNLRIVNGTALYTSNFNTSAPISPLTPLTNVANTVLLLNGSYVPLPPKIYVGGVPAVYPGAPAGYKTSGVGNSLFFNSNYSDNLAHGASPKFNFSGDFTMECWIQTSTYTSDASVSRRIFSFGTAAANNLELILGTASVNNNLISTYAGGININGTIVAADGNWHHIAVTRSGSTIRLFVDGVIAGSTTSSAIYNRGVTGGLTIGAYTSTTGRFHGYMNNIRIVNGTAVYTSDFSNNLPGDVDAIPNTVLLLKDNRQTLLYPNDNTIPYTYEISPYGSASANISLSSASPFGTGTDASMCFNGTSSYYLYGASGLHNFTGGIFTIECWVLFAATSAGAASSTIASNWSSATTGWTWLRDSSNVIKFYANGNSLVITGSALSNNTWYHMVIAGMPGSISMYANGVKVGSTYVSSIANFSGGATYLGKTGGSGTDYLNGCISNFRISERFTLPTRQLTSTQLSSTNITSVSAGQTIFLLNNTSTAVTPQSAFVDYSGNNYAVTNTTAVAYSPLSPYYDTNLVKSNKITPDAIHAVEFDEITYQNAGGGLTKRETPNGKVYVTGYIDEVTGIVL